MSISGSLAVSAIVPAFAQQKDTADPQITEQLKALSKKTDEANNNGDAAAVAALYTEDAVLVTDTGPIYGREAIEKHGTGLLGVSFGTAPTALLRFWAEN